MKNNPLILSLFPGIGLLDLAFEEAGFCVVRGPDILWGGDVKKFHPPRGKFEGIIGGPPCQAFSSLRHIVEHHGNKKSENLIPEFERCVREAKPLWFLMENVTAAPLPRAKGYNITSFTLNNRYISGMIGEIQNRVRRFSFGQRDGDGKLQKYIEYACFENQEFEPAVCASGGYRDNPKGRKSQLCNNGWKTNKSLRKSLRLQGLPENLLDLSPFTVIGKHKVIGNGVPLPMGRAIANAVKEALCAGK